MHSIQSSKGRHNIFSETDHDRKLIDTVSQKTKSSKRVAFADTGVVLPPISSPTSSTVLPDIDLNVRKKLASNDLHVKFSHKSNVLTVASTLSKKEKSGKEDNEDTLGMDIEGGNHDDLDRISVKSNYSENLEQLKLEMTLASSMSGYSPLTSPSRSIVGPFSPVTLENGENHLEDMLDENFQKIDEYDDDDHGRFGTEMEEHQYSRTDPKLYKSTLHAHEQFMNKSKLKNNMKYIKTVGSTKTLPANEMIEETKKARSVLESASFSPTKSSKHESIKSPMTPPPKSPSQLKPLTTSFMFLSALTIGKVPKLAREEKQLKEMQQQVISNNNENKLGVNTYTTDDIAYGMDENKALSPMFSPERGDEKHFRAPLERTNSPVMKPNLSTKTFTRFGASNMSATTVLRSIKSLDGRTSPSSLPMEEEKKNEVKKEPTEAGDDNEEEEGTIDKLKKLVAGPTYEASTHLYDIPTLTALNEDKRAVLKGMDNVVNNLTYVKAPEKPKAPAPKSPEPLTLQSVLGEHLMEHNPDEPLPVTDDEFNQLVFGNKDFTIEGHAKLKKFQELQKDKTNPYLKKQQQQSNKSHNTNNNYINSPTPTITSIPKQEENTIVESNDAPLQPSSQKSSKSKKLLRSSSDNNCDPVTGESMRSLDSNYSSATFVPYNPDEPTYVPHNDPRLPPLDFAALHNPQTNNWSSAASVNSNMGSVAMDPPPRRRSFLNLAANPYGMMRQSFLRNFNKRNGMSTDSSDQVIARSGSGAASTVHDYTKALSQTTQHFLSAIAKQFSRSHDIMSGPAGGGSVSVQNNDPFILPSDDFYQPKYYILNEGKDFGDDESFASPKTNQDNYHHSDEEQKKKVRGKQDYKLEKIEQPLSNPKQEFVYQYSTNSYVPKDYINHSAYGFYQRGGGLNEGMDSPYPDNSNYNEKEEYRKRKEEYFSERHLERIEDTTTGKCEPVIYLPPNLSQPKQHQLSSLPSEHYEGEEGGEDSYGGGENASLHSHNILKVYSRNASHQKMLTPGLVIAETAYHKVTDLIENPDPKQPHYIHHQPKHAHVTFNDEPEEKKGGEDEEDEEDVLPSQTRMKTSPPLAIMTSPQSDYLGSSKKNLFPTSSNLDLRDEIAQFRHKTNSPLRHEYEQHVEKTMAKPTSLNPHFGSSMSTVSIDNQSLASFASPVGELSQSRRPSDSRRSISSDISVNKDDAHQKLWEKLHSRYSGDREGEYQTKLKVAQYLKDGVKEETQIMKKYLEEIEEW